jgi:hypothetical protein
VIAHRANVRIFAPTINNALTGEPAMSEQSSVKLVKAILGTKMATVFDVNTTGRLEMLKIDICMDHVSIEGQIIKRPARVSRSDWLRYWERVSHNCGYLGRTW